jgi:TonB family protein
MWPGCSLTHWNPQAGASMAGACPPGPGPAGAFRLVRIAIAALGLALACAWPPAARAQSQAEIEAALDLYIYRLVQSMRQVRSYPQQALDEQLEGDCAVELVLSQDGTLRSVTVITSTGHAILDEHARDLARRLVPLTEIPSTLQNKAFAVRFAMAFRLPG